MRALWKTRLALLFAVLLSGCAAYQAQHRARPAPYQGSGDLTAPVAERSISETARDDAGSEENREIIDQFARETTAKKKSTLLSQLSVFKQELAEQGKYDCCVRPGCNECVLNRGECHCRVGVEHGAPCCGECTAAWIEGRGNVPGVDKEQILRNLGCYRELYEGDPQADESSAPNSSDHQP